MIDLVDELADLDWEFTLQALDGSGVAPAAVLLWTLTLYSLDATDLAIVNARDAVVLVTNGVVAAPVNGLGLTYLAGTGSPAAPAGRYRLHFPAADQVILNPALALERHLAQLYVALAGTPPQVKRPSHEFHVRNLGRVPAPA